MRTLVLLMLCMVSFCSFGQVTAEQLLGKWYLRTFHIDSMLVIDRQDPMKVVRQNMHRLKEIKPAYKPADSAAYAEDVLKKIAAFDHYFIEFLADGSYRNTKIVQGKVTADIEEGQFRLIDSGTALVQEDKANRVSTSSIEINDGILKLVFNVGDRKTIFRFERRE
jgi:hypothetical protein